MVVGLVTGLAGVWNPESYGWGTGLGKVRTMDIRGRKNLFFLPLILNTHFLNGLDIIIIIIAKFLFILSINIYNLWFPIISKQFH